MIDRLSLAPLEQALIWYARHFPVRRGKLRLVDTLWHAAAGFADPRRVAKLIYGNYRIPCDLDETLQRQFYFLAPTSWNSPC